MLSTVLSMPQNRGFCKHCGELGVIFYLACGMCRAFSGINNREAQNIPLEPGASWAWAQMSFDILPRCV